MSLRTVFMAAMTVSLLFTLSPAHATRTWEAFDGSPPGTLPTIELDPGSSPEQTILNVVIHGLWVEEIQEGTDVFEYITTDGFSSDEIYDVIGRPDLPAIKIPLANGTVATEGSVQVVQNDIYVYPPFSWNIYPVQPPYLDNGDPPPPFEWDETFYENTMYFYPAEDASPFIPVGRFAGLDVAFVEAYPIKWMPATGELSILTDFDVIIDHLGPEVPEPRSISRRLARQYAGMFVNYPVYEPWLDELEIYFAGDFLFITPEEFRDTIEPLVDQKVERGYDVEVFTTENIGVTWQEIREAISDWYYAGDTEADRYVVLVGDTQFIPTALDNGDRSSDMIYVCIEGTYLDGLTDPFPEARLGRFPADNVTQLERMISKTLTYEDGYPMSGGWLDNVLLVAHEEEYPDKYTQAQEDVRTASYTVPPVFDTAYGAENGNTDASVRSIIDEGRGVVCYRGHGVTSSWVNWNYLQEDFSDTDVGLLANGVKTPVVFAITCTNSNVNSTSIAEAWMASPVGAVAHYGATDVSKTQANHTLDFQLFKAIFKDNKTIISEAIMAAELKMITHHGGEGIGNAFIYMLCGDPELKVWRKAPNPPMLTWNPNVPPGAGDFSARTTDPDTGDPIEGLLVTLPVHGPNGEYGGAYYTDANGDCVIPIDGALLSQEYGATFPLGCYDEFSDWGFTREEVPIESSDAPESESASLRLSLGQALPNPFAGQTTVRYAVPAGGPVSLVVVDLQGRKVATLVDGVQPAGSYALRWSGRDDLGRRLGSGVYFSLLESGGQSRRTKVVVRR